MPSIQYQCQYMRMCRKHHSPSASACKGKIWKCNSCKCALAFLIYINSCITACTMLSNPVGYHSNTTAHKIHIHSNQLHIASRAWGGLLHGLRRNAIHAAAAAAAAAFLSANVSQSCPRDRSIQRLKAGHTRRARFLSFLACRCRSSSSSCSSTLRSKPAAITWCKRHADIKAGLGMTRCKGRLELASAPLT